MPRCFHTWLRVGTDGDLAAFQCAHCRAMSWKSGTPGSPTLRLEPIPQALIAEEYGDGWMHLPSVIPGSIGVFDYLRAIASMPELGE